MNSAPTPRIRLTISVTPEVHEIYTRLSKAAGASSLGRTMGDWLGDTAEAAAFTAATLERARQAPRDAINRINVMTASLVAQNEEMTGLLTQRADAAEQVRADRREHAPAKPEAPSSLTGLNTPSKRKPRAA